jgi:hypothetical protein
MKKEVKFITLENQKSLRNFLNRQLTECELEISYLEEKLSTSIYELDEREFDTLELENLLFRKVWLEDKISKF